MLANTLMIVLVVILRLITLPVWAVLWLPLVIADKMAAGIPSFLADGLWSGLSVPVLWLSGACEGRSALRSVIGVLGLPVALLPQVLLALIPDSGTPGYHMARRLETEAWPYSAEFRRFWFDKEFPRDPREREEFRVLIERLGSLSDDRREVIDRLSYGEMLDAMGGD